MVSDYDNKTYLLRITSGTTMLAILLLAGNAYATAAIVGTWQYPEETITFYENGKFAGNNTQIGAFNGTYTTQGDILTLRYVFPAAATAQFTFAWFREHVTTFTYFSTGNLYESWYRHNYYFWNVAIP